METQVLALFLVLACACVTLANPANDRREDLSHLVSLLGQLKGIERVRQNPPPGAAPANAAARGSDFSQLADAADVTEDFVDEESLSKGYLGRPTGPVNKRQGAWSYDYGLGGGRFGKRNYGDYGIGGGRFGRDVDHVDLSDANDADMTS